MPEKKELNLEELEEINGGATLDNGAVRLCPKCNKNLYPRDVETLGSGCDTYKRYTCPRCGHQWEEH